MSYESITFLKWKMFLIKKEKNCMNFEFYNRLIILMWWQYFDFWMYAWTVHMSFEFVVHECWLLKEWWKRRHVTEDLKNHKNDSWSKKKQWIQKKRRRKTKKKERKKKKEIKVWSKAKRVCLRTLDTSNWGL